MMTRASLQTLMLRRKARNEEKKADAELVCWQGW
jgi:hypothetical protein